MSTLAITELEEIKQSLLSEIQAIDVAIRIIRSKMVHNDLKPIAVKIEGVKPKQIATPVISTGDKGTDNEAVNVDAVRQSIGELKRFVKIATIIEDIYYIGLTKDAIRSAITYLKKKGVLVPFQATSNNADTYWGFKEWMENGKIKSEFMYDKSTLFKKK